MRLGSQILRDLAQGQADVDFATAISEATASAIDTGRAATVLLEVTIAPHGPNPERDGLDVTHAITVTKPTVPSGTTRMFADPNYALAVDFALSPEDQRLYLADSYGPSTVDEAVSKVIPYRARGDGSGPASDR